MVRAVILLALLLIPAAAAVAGDLRDDLYAAQGKEHAEGDLEGALELYRSAARSEDPQVRLPARLGEARCLRRLARPGEARGLLESLLASELPATVAASARRELSRLVGPSDETETPETEAKELRADLDRAREEAARLRESLDKAAGNDEEIERLRAELAEKDSLMRELAERLRGLAQDGVDPLEVAYRAELVAYALSQARALHGEARFDEAREWVKKALAQDPTNAEARELLARLGDTLGERERLVHEVLRLLEMERRIHRDDLRLEVDALISSGQELLVQGELDRAYDTFTECIALVDAHSPFRRDLVVRRERASQFLDRVIKRGGGPRGDHPPPVRLVPPAEGRWRKTLRSLLANVGSSSRPGGKRLRIYDLSSLDDSRGSGTPPSGELGISSRRPALTPLLAALVPVLTRPGAFAEGGYLVRSQGSDLIVYASERILTEMAGFLDRLSARQDPPAHLVLRVLAVEPQAVSDTSSRLGLTFSERDGAGRAILASDEESRFVTGLLEGRRGVMLGEIEITVPPGRTVGVEHLRDLNLVVPPASPDTAGVKRVEHGLKVGLLPVRSGREYGLAVSIEIRSVVDTLMVPASRGGELQIPTIVEETSDIAVRVPEDRALAVVGLLNPFPGGGLSTRTGLVLLVSVKASGSSEAGPAAGPGVDAEAPEEPPAAVPVDLGGLALMVTDEPAPLFRGERIQAVESRTGFLLRQLREALGEEILQRPGVSFTIGGGVTWVHGGDEVVGRVRSAVAGLLANRDRLVTLHVRAARLSAADESLQLRGLAPGGVVLEGEGVRSFVLRGEERRRVSFFAAGTKGRISMLSGVLAARSTQLVNLTRVTRFGFLRDIRPSGDRGYRPLFGTVDEGIAVEMRPVVLADETVDLTLKIRVARILAEGAIGRNGKALVVEEPVQAVSVARVRARLTAGDTLLVAGLPAPTPMENRRDRLVVLIEAAPGMPK